MMYWQLVTPLVLVLGLIVGSFLGALTYRIPRGISISDGRSFCPRCKKTIAWYDNIPLVSYIILGGRCRNCRSKISIRYPLIELTTSVLIFLTYVQAIACIGADKNIVCEYFSRFGWWSLPYLWIMIILLVAIFIVDLEKKIIPDEFSLSLFVLAVVGIVIGGFDDFYLRVLFGFLVASFLLFLHLLTGGRGMGLGDVKLALFAPVVLGDWRNVFVWISGSFLVGAVVGTVLIALRRGSFGKPIAFSPFMVISFLLVMFLSDKIRMILPVFL